MRQRTLEATLEWSYSLLTEPERVVLERLSVFVGGCSLLAAETVCAGGPNVGEGVLEQLDQLIDKSLLEVKPRANGDTHYECLETVREYALEKLASRGASDVAAVRDRHAAFYSSQVEQVCAASRASAEPLSGDAVAAPLLDTLDGMLGNLRAVMAWLLEMKRPVEGLRLAVALGDFWWMRGIYTEGRYWLETMLELTDALESNAGPIPTELRARALGFAGLLASRQGDYTQAQIDHEASVKLWRVLQNPTELANALAWVGLDLWVAHEPDRAHEVLVESLRLGRAAGDGNAVAATLRNLGMLARSQADYAHAAELFREAASLAQSLGWYRGYPYVRAVAHLGRVAYLSGDFETASGLYQRVLALAREAHVAGHALAECLDWLAAVEGVRGKPHRAARLFGAAAAQWRECGAVRYAPDRQAYERDVDAVRGQIDMREFTTGWVWGMAMNEDQAIAYALQEGEVESRPAGDRQHEPNLGVARSDGAANPLSLYG